MVILILGLGNLSCSSQAAKPTSSPGQTSSTQTSTSKSGSTPAGITTPLARPLAGKSQELTFALKAPTNMYSYVIYLASGETLDLDWKFVANPQAGIRFMFTTPEGREMDAKSQPINLPGHPLYDQSLATQKLEDVVGSHVEINVGQNKYCGEGYYSLIFSGNSTQSGTVYLRYTLIQPTK